MNEELIIPVILGASRPERKSERVANFILQVLREDFELESPLVDVRDFQIEYDEDKSIPEFRDIITKSDALVLVFPEYNHGFPGKLKSLLDTEFDIYKHKPVVLASVSSGHFGGVRATELLTPILTNFKLIVTGLNLHFPYINEVFDESGNLNDSQMNERAKKVLSELMYLTKVIKIGKRTLDEKNV